MKDMRFEITTKYKFSATEETIGYANSLVRAMLMLNTENMIGNIYILDDNGERIHKILIGFSGMAAEYTYYSDEDHELCRNTYTRDSDLSPVGIIKKGGEVNA